jgi:cytochrome c-type biogenesis protein
MVPIYLTYLAGGGMERDTKKTVQRALGFILGFTMVFVALGAFAGLLGLLLSRYETVVNIVAGAIVVLFGLNYLGVINIRFLNETHSAGSGDGNVSGFFSAALFGLVFSISWTPCVGMFLGAALMKAARQGTVIEGILLLFCYSLGLGIPFFISAVLVDKLKSAFAWIKRHYKVVKLVSGLFLIAVGIMMMTGLMSRYFALF